MHARRSHQIHIDSIGHNSNPAEWCNNILRIAQNISGNNLFVFNIEIGRKKFIEKNQTAHSRFRQAFNHFRQIGKVTAYFQSNGNFHFFENFLNDIKIKLLLFGTILTIIGGKQKHIQFQCIGTGILDFFSKINPFVIGDAIHTGNYRNIHSTFSIFYQFDIIGNIILFNLRIVIIEEPFVKAFLDSFFNFMLHFKRNFLFKNRAKDNCRNACLLQVPNAFDIIRKSGTGSNNRVF